MDEVAAINSKDLQWYMVEAFEFLRVEFEGEDAAGLLVAWAKVQATVDEAVVRPLLYSSFITITNPFYRISAGSCQRRIARSTSATGTNDTARWPTSCPSTTSRITAKPG